MVFNSTADLFPFSSLSNESGVKPTMHHFVWTKTINALNLRKNPTDSFSPNFSTQTDKHEKKGIKDEREFQIAVSVDAYPRKSLCQFTADPGIKFRHHSEDMMGRSNIQHLMPEIQL